jgi:hypothetical protein
MLTGFLIAGALIFLLWQNFDLFRSQKSAFRKKYRNYDWTYGKMKITYSSLSDPSRKMKFPTKVRGDMDRMEFQRWNFTPRCNGYRPEPDWIPVEDETLKQKIHQHLQENGEQNPHILYFI